MRFYLPVTNRLPLIVALLSVSISGCATTTAGTATPAGPVPLTTEQTLPGVLLSAADVGSALGSDDVVVTREVSTPWDHSAYLQAQSPTGATPGCLAITGAAQRGAYADSGWTAVLGQVLREPPAARAWSHFATQSVVLFATAQAASEFFGRSSRDWAECADREMTYAQPLTPDQVWAVGEVSSEGDMLTVSRTQRSPQQWSCQRALTVRGNVAVDIEACSLDGPTDAAAAIAGAIGERLPAA